MSECETKELLQYPCNEPNESVIISRKKGQSVINR